MSVIPGEIAHLDFETPVAPEVKPTEEEFTLLKPCKCFPHGKPEQKCDRPAGWRGAFRCCGKKFIACNYHKRSSVSWWCPDCCEDRHPDWMGWTEL